MSKETIEIDGQYRATREGAGWLERPGITRITVSGAEAAEFLQGQITNDVEAFEPGAGCYAALLDRKGKIRADMRVLRLAEDRFVIDADGSVAALLLKHLSMYNVGRDAAVADVAAETRLISLIGPRAEELAGVVLRPEHAHREADLGGVRCLLVATDLGVDIFFPGVAFDAVPAALEAAGAEPISEQAAEIARVESGRPRLGRELGPQTMPQEAGINERAVSFTKGCYVGQETVARLHYKGKPNRHLRMLTLDAPVAEGEPVRLGERELGTIGTAVISPDRGPIALAILRREAEPGAEVHVGEGTSARVEEIER